MTYFSEMTDIQRKEFERVMCEWEKCLAEMMATEEEDISFVRKDWYYAALLFGEYVLNVPEKFFGIATPDWDLAYSVDKSEDGTENIAVELYWELADTAREHKKYVWISYEPCTNSGFAKFDTEGTVEMWHVLESPLCAATWDRAVSALTKIFESL